MNAQTERVFGYSREELVGQPVELLLPPADQARHHHHRDAYFRDPKVRVMGSGLELHAARRDGSTFPVG